jgi:hypothetical protein
MADPTLLSVVMGGLGIAAGVVGKSLWERAVGWRSRIPMEVWKIRTSQLEKRLSQFYWPLFIRLQRDDVIWKKVYRDLLDEDERPEWVADISEKSCQALANEIESKVILPNHLQATTIIRENIHLANADAELIDLLAKYTRHVDVFSSMRSAGIADFDPIAVDEPYPENLSDAVRVRLVRFQTEYEDLLRDKGILDLRQTVWPPKA